MQEIWKDKNNLTHNLAFPTIEYKVYIIMSN
jgi:hypothetical protein